MIIIAAVDCTVLIFTILERIGFKGGHVKLAKSHTGLV